MPQQDWYRRKADECARMAKDASDPATREHYEHDERLWRQIADHIVKTERDQFGPG
jgi:hypothetical protein